MTSRYHGLRHNICTNNDANTSKLWYSSGRLDLSDRNHYTVCHPSWYSELEDWSIQLDALTTAFLVDLVLQRLS